MRQSNITPAALESLRFADTKISFANPAFANTDTQGYAFDAGCKAFKDGLDQSTNPYPSSLLLYHWWLEGWNLR